jgi:hypothetical protein
LPVLVREDMSWQWNLFFNRVERCKYNMVKNQTV